VRRGEPRFAEPSWVADASPLYCFAGVCNADAVYEKEILPILLKHLDKKMKKKELSQLSGVSGSTLAKLYRGENVNMDVLVKICNVLRCEISDIMEVEFDDIPEAK